MPWIKNYDLASVYNGYLLEKDEDFKNSERTIIIQIFDPAATRPIPHDLFKSGKVDSFRVYEFLDIDRGMEGFDEFSITREQAVGINLDLQKALLWDYNVVVHCFAGIARSGAVVEHAVKMGFEDKGLYRAPNKDVLSMLQSVSR